MIRWTTNEAGAHVVDVIGIKAGSLAALRDNERPSARWQELFNVRADQGDLIADIESPPMLGRYSVTGNSLRFEPLFPLDPGIAYRATLVPARLPGGGGKQISATRPARPKVAHAPTAVAAVHPSASVLPENLLKFYLHFSAPMSRGDVYEHIRLLDEAGDAVELPFLELEQELWNSDQTRLTVILDPGRIKRGLRPLEENGPALAAGKRYTLVIDRGWRDSRGQALRAVYKKPFTVAPPDRDPPDTARWKIIPPARQTRGALVVEFDEPLDAALAARLLTVHTDAGTPVSGRIKLSDDDRRWEFVPDAGWQPGPHTIRVQKLIEDLAGNNIGKPFDVELTVATPEETAPQAGPGIVSLAFQPR